MSTEFISLLFLQKLAILKNTKNPWNFFPYSKMGKNPMGKIKLVK